MKQIFRLFGRYTCFLLPVLLLSCAEQPEVAYKKTTFQEIPGWSQDSLENVREAFSRSCEGLLHQESTQTKVWQGLCRQMETLEKGDLRSFFERNFQPVEVSSRREFLSTGYYVPDMEGSFEKTTQYQTPLYRRPANLLTIDLGRFSKEFTTGKKLIGRIEDREVVPYFSRREIDTVAPLADADVLLWLKDPIDAFFLHIQGSGRVTLPSGNVVHVGYDTDNGHTYTSIGKVLVEKEEMVLEEVSLESLKTWLKQNPQQRQEILAQNARYIFFRLSEKVAVGALGQELVTERSVAIDPAYIPLGWPVFVNTELAGREDESYQRLMFAQDTGGAIKGPHRVDLFFGWGKQAEKLAGNQKGHGQIYLLVPREFDGKLNSVIDL